MCAQHLPLVARRPPRAALARVKQKQPSLSSSSLLSYGRASRRREAKFGANNHHQAASARSLSSGRCARARAPAPECRRANECARVRVFTAISEQTRARRMNKRLLRLARRRLQSFWRRFCLHFCSSDLATQTLLALRRRRRCRSRSNDWRLRARAHVQVGACALTLVVTNASRVVVELLAAIATAAATAAARARASRDFCYCKPGCVP